MIDEQETGPLTRVELGVELASGAITPESLVWKQGMINWIPGAKVPELAALFKNPPRSPRAAGARRPPLPKKQEKGVGLGEFDTAHFRLADLAPEDTGSSRNLEFDTAHFKLAELKAEDDGQSRQMEFDTAHFRLQDLKGAQGARALVPKRIVPQGMEPPPEEPAPPRSLGEAAPRTTLRQASTAAVKQSSPVAVRQMPPPVAAEPPMAKATQRPAPKPATAQPHVAELSKWAASEVESGAKENARHRVAPKKQPLPPPPVPVAPPPEKSHAWLAIGLAAVLVIACAILWFLLSGD